MALKRADLGQIVPKIQISPSVTILDPGSKASITNEGSEMNQVLVLSIPKGDKGEQGEQGPQGIQGEQGKPFQIAKTYHTIADMNSDYAAVEPGSFVVISGKEKPDGTIDVDDPDVGKLYVRTTDDGNENDQHYTFLTDLSGAQGIQGPKGDTGENGKDGKDGKDGLTYKYWFGISEGGHLLVYYDDEAKDPTGSGMGWSDWKSADVINS